MKKIYALAIVGALLASGGAFAADFTGTGEIVELHCYSDDNSKKGAGHVGCAKSCFGDGSPIGLLMSDDSVMTLVAESDDVKASLINLAGEQATVSGSADGDTVMVTSAAAAG